MKPHGDVRERYQEAITMKISFEDLTRATDLVNEAERIFFPVIQGKTDFDNPIYKCWDVLATACTKLQLLKIQEAAS